MLSDIVKKYLLNVARNSIEAVVKKGDLPEIDLSSPELRQNRGAFVTLHEGGELRGCIGYTEAVKPLGETVREVAVKAAMEDPRFAAVSEDELPYIKIEISVLSPMKFVKNIEEIEIGKHGIMIELKNFRGLLLPQVPEEYGWDRDTFLEQTARKAGLPPNAWKYTETKISIFTAEIFSEHSSETVHK